MTNEPNRNTSAEIEEIGQVRPPAGDSCPSSTTALPAPSRQNPRPRLPVGYTLGWVLALILAVLTTAQIMRPAEPVWLQRAFAQAWEGGTGAGLGARGIFAFPAQVGPKEYGVFMMDVDSGTLWCYEIARSRTGEPFLKLLAARNWLADRYLDEFNVAEPTPSQVRELIDQQRAIRGTGGPVRSPTAPPESPARPITGPAPPLELPESP